VKRAKTEKADTKGKIVTKGEKNEKAEILKKLAKALKSAATFVEELAKVI